jgi:alpha/beta superfamily hydrolase
MLKDFEEVDQERLLKPVQCPVLIIHGNGDDEERLLLENSRKAMPLLPEDSRLEVINGATHSFMGYLSEVEKLAADWLEQHLGPRK